MKKVVPDYYKDFRCIADKCRHSCCIGWEIDIDRDTLLKYENVGGEFGHRLRENIKEENGVSSFVLCEGERCPFLDKRGLCDIIKELGEDHLSQICTDHPRFRNFFSDREEIGLGLCCEEACRMILSKDAPTSLEVLYDDGADEFLFEDEAVILTVREKLFDIARDRNFSVDVRCKKILETLDVSLTDVAVSEWVEFFSKLEIMDNGWKEYLDRLHYVSFWSTFDKVFEKSFEQLLVYFLFRYIADAEDISDLAARGLFAVFSVRFINSIFCSFSSDKRCFYILSDICRRYSSEIEYCEENVERLLDKLSGLNM